jgi:Holliday junction DNA helicase RuvB
VGAETLAISVGEGIDSLEDFYEPYLIQRGFLMRTPRGRMATPLAYQHLGLESLWTERRDEDQGNLF